METAGPGGRALKRRVRELLGLKGSPENLEELCRFPVRRVINPLFSFFNSTDQELRWAAVIASGAVVAKLAREDMEGARVVMRRLMWHLNDESGGIGWGCPEAMGEILASHGGLAEEYVHILISYTKEEENYLEHEGLQRGLLWGIGRLCLTRPGLVKRAGPSLVPYLSSGDASVRGHAAWVSGLAGQEAARDRLEALRGDTAPFETFRDLRIITLRVRDAAEEALASLGAPRAGGVGPGS